MEPYLGFKLKESRIREIPFDLYAKDFKFKVNGETYETNRLIADLLSPQVCSFHYTDPTINELHLNTTHQGDFQQILNLIKYEEHPIYTKDLPFFSEILQLLNNKWIEIESKTRNKEESLTIDKAIELLSEHSKYNIFYSNLVNEEIEFISSHFYEVKMSHIKKIIEID